MIHKDLLLTIVIGVIAGMAILGLLGFGVYKIYTLEKQVELQGQSLQNVVNFLNQSIQNAQGK